jgi:predicted phosphodiesterase
VRRNLSRGESADFFKPQPGSQFVIQVMNAIKRDYPFVDLLKPEDAAVPPFLAFLRPDLAQTMKDIGGSVREWIATKFRASDMGGDSTRDLTEDPVSARMAETDAMMALVDAVASDASAWEAHTTDGQRGSTGAFLSLLFGAKDVSRERAVQLDKLREVLRARVGSEGQAFNVDIESEQYLDAARNSARHGAQVVVYGHTHLVKRVDLGGGAVYLNTGTWADLMRVPTAVLREETPRDAALRELAEFADDLNDRERVSRWRRQVPTFARVELGDDRAVRAADVHRYREGTSLDAMKIPDGPLDF